MSRIFSAKDFLFPSYGAEDDDDDDDEDGPDVAGPSMGAWLNEDGELDSDDGEGPQPDARKEDEAVYRPSSSARPSGPSAEASVTTVPPWRPGKQAEGGTGKRKRNRNRKSKPFVVCACGCWTFMHKLSEGDCCWECDRPWPTVPAEPGSDDDAPASGAESSDEGRRSHSEGPADRKRGGGKKRARMSQRRVFVPSFHKDQDEQEED